MKSFSFKLVLLASIALIGFNAMAQLPKITKPKITTPTISMPNSGGGSNSGGSTPSVLVKDPSGLFTNVTDDPSAQSHRRIAAENLEKMDSWFKSGTVDYDDLSKLLFENERELGYVVKLEPKVDRSKYDARYLPLKARAEKEDAIYKQAVELEKTLKNEFNASAEFEKHNPMTFRTESYGAHQQCYCRNDKADVKPLADYEATKKQYLDLTAQLTGYKDEGTQNLITNMASCYKNGNSYAVWASKENLNEAVVAYSTTTKPAEPKKVITRCEEYLAALGRVETDNSFPFDAATKTAIAEGKAACNKTKADAETYISSGEFQKYKDKVRAEQAAKEFMPAAKGHNTTLEAGAATFIKGTEYAEYLVRIEESPVVSTMRTVMETEDYYVHKNDIGIPEYQYHEFTVAYKAKDGRCYKATVYATYTYKGGGTYATVPKWSADAPVELACANVTK
jgi:hypothetical protein